MKKLKQWLKQRRFTKHHRANESDNGPRLARLDDYPVPTLMGYRPWCDARLQDCFVPGHTQCCYCTHTERNPYQEATSV